MPSSPRPRRPLEPLLVALTLLLYWAMAVSVSPRLGVTADEVGHLTGGFSYWKFNDYRLQPENGMLPMRVAALPLLSMDLKFPPLDSADWLTSRADHIGHAFFYELGNPVDTMLQRARMMIALLGVFTVWLTWRWTRRLFGRPAGWVALVLAAFCPALLAHGGLATSDMAGTACLLILVTLFWRLLHVVTWPRVLATTVVGAAVLLAKMSGVLAVPMLAGLLVLRWLQPAPLVVRLAGPARWLRRRPAVIAATSALAIGTALAGLALLWGAYSFRYEAANRLHSDFHNFNFDWAVMLETAPPPGASNGAPVSRLAEHLPSPAPTPLTRMIGWVREHRLLPEAYLWGFANTYKGTRARTAFLNGRHGTQGWPEFFPLAFAMKTTLPALALGLLGGALALAGRLGPGRQSRWLWRAAPLLMLLLVYGAFALRSHLNIGLRHILPLYPVFYVLAGGAGAWLWRRHRRLAWPVIALAVAAHATDSLAARPFYVSYFNQPAGGTNSGWRHLVDSSYDWGQGLPDLATWLDHKAAAGDTGPVYLTYFGADNPQWRHLAVTRFGDETNDSGPRAQPVYPHGGWFAISATHFQRIYLGLPGSWTARHEQLYLESREALAQWTRHPPALPAERNTLLRDAQDFELLEFGRLCHFLEARRPDAIIGGSLLLFRLSDAEAALALHAPLEIVDRALAHPPTP